MDPRADNSQMHTAAEVTAPRRTTNFDNDHYADDLRSAFSGVPRLRHTWIDRYMKMLVVGESGQGAPCKKSSCWLLACPQKRQERVKLTLAPVRLACTPASNRLWMQCQRIWPATLQS